MADSYTQLYIHIVFAVEHRDRIIRDYFREELHKYITSIIQHKGNKLIAINSMPDHIHLFIGLNPAISISTLVKEIKLSTDEFINKKKWVRGNFRWQEGYGAFSYSRSHVDNVVKYIRNQQEHHRVTTFREEYIKILEAFKIKYNSSYVFKFFDEEHSTPPE